MLQRVTYEIISDTGGNCDDKYSIYLSDRATKFPPTLPVLTLLLRSKRKKGSFDFLLQEVWKRNVT